jgi:hypothetical protein
LVGLEVVQTRPIDSTDEGVMSTASFEEERVFLPADRQTVDMSGTKAQRESARRKRNLAINIYDLFQIAYGYDVDEPYRQMERLAEVNAARSRRLTSETFKSVNSRMAETIQAWRLQHVSALMDEVNLGLLAVRQTSRKAGEEDGLWLPLGLRGGRALVRIECVEPCLPEDNAPLRKMQISLPHTAEDPDRIDYADLPWPGATLYEEYLKPQLAAQNAA